MLTDQCRGRQDCDSDMIHGGAGGGARQVWTGAVCVGWGAGKISSDGL